MYKDSLRVTEKNLSNLALNGNKFKITEAATEEDLNHFNKFWRCSWITRSSIWKKIGYFQSQCSQRAYYFHIFKCNFTECTYDGALVGPTITRFPSPILYNNNPSGVEHYKEGKDSKKKFLPSKLNDAINRKFYALFQTSAKTALNVGISLRCVSCTWPPSMYLIKWKASGAELKILKRLLKSFQYICGTALQDMIVTKNSPESKMLKKVFTSENLSCTANIEAQYYSCAISPKACDKSKITNYCDKSSSLEQDDNINYPQCRDAAEKILLSWTETGDGRIASEKIGAPVRTILPNKGNALRQFFSLILAKTYFLLFAGHLLCFMYRDDVNYDKKHENHT